MIKIDVCEAGESVTEYAFHKIDGSVLKVALSSHEGEEAEQSPGEVSTYNKDFVLFVWPSALVLSAYVVLNYNELVLNKHVLELGAGKGLCSEVAKRLGARSITATDLKKPRLSEGIHTKKLTWGTFGSESLNTLSSKIDIVLGSDVLYEEHGVSDLLNKERVEALFATISMIRKFNPHMKFVTAVVYRSDCFMEIVKTTLRAWGFQITQLVDANEIVVCHQIHEEIEIFVIE